MEDKNTLVLIDGKNQNDVGDINASGLEYNSLPPLAMIERIEIIKGPMSARYGSDAIGGVINIITKKITNEWIGSFSLSQTFLKDSEHGGDGTSDFAILGPLIKNLLGLSLRGSWLDRKPSVQRDEDGRELGKATKQVNWSAGAGLALTPNANHTIRLNYDTNRQKRDNSTAQQDSYEVFWEDQITRYVKTMRTYKDQISLDYEAIWDFGKSNFGIHRIESDNNARTLPFNAEERKLFLDNKKPGEKWETLEKAMTDPVFLALFPRPARVMRSMATTYSADYEMPFEKHLVYIGAEYYDGSHEDGEYSLTWIATSKSGGVTHDEKKLSIILEDTWSMFDNFALTSGVRYEKNDLYDGHFSPKIYGVYTPFNNWTVKGGVATGYKVPEPEDIIDGIKSFGGWNPPNPRFGSPGLEPEKSVTGEIAVYYNHEAGHNFNTTFYKTRYDGKIDQISEGPNKLLIYTDWAGPGIHTRPSFQTQRLINLDEYVYVHGVEISGGLQLLDNLALRANYTYSDSSKDEDGRPFLSNAAKHVYSANLDLDFNKLSTSLQISGEPERLRSWGTTEGANYYKEHVVFDLNAAYALTDNVTIYTTILNLLDTDFTERIEYIDEDGLLKEAAAYRLTQKRREIWVKLEVTF